MDHLNWNSGQRQPDDAVLHTGPVGPLLSNLTHDAKHCYDISSEVIKNFVIRESRIFLSNILN